jgi:hypothetical protein
MRSAETRTTPPVANAVYEFRSNDLPVALVACFACRMMLFPTNAATNPMINPTIAKSCSTNPKIVKEVEDAKLVNITIVADVALTTPGWTPIVNIIGTVITSGLNKII